MCLLFISLIFLFFFSKSINVGNVYISDAAGLRYSLSLPKNVRTTSGECEFDRVASLEGVYIANFQADPPRRSLDIEDSSTTTSNGDEEDEDEVGLRFQMESLILIDFTIFFRNWMRSRQELKNDIGRA